MALTDKQEKFVQELIKGKSQREAYRNSFNCKNYSDKTLDETACKLLKSPKVYARYTELHDRLIKESEEQCIIEAKEVLKEIVSIARDDIGNYLRFYNNGGQIQVDIKDSDTIDTKNISEVSIGKDGQFKFKTYCRDTALYKLAEYLNIGDTAKNTQEIEDDELSKSLKELGGKL